MKIIVALLLVFAIGLTGCKTPEQKERDKKAALTKKTKAKLRDEDTDLDFQAFIGRLRKAVAAHDVASLKSMMTSDFGFRLEPKMEGLDPSAGNPGVFQYWDEQGLWPELQGILSEKFVKYKGFMVAPPQFSEESLNYDGYRAGIRRVNGSWKFAYFVNG
ncbi:MAG: hypothetical protein ABI925_13055 [Verrucomicrobiota bacterium]